MTEAHKRPRRYRLRKVFEVVLLVASLVMGLGVVGACVVQSTGTTRLLGGGVAVIFAAVLIGAVFLFTTMSRDLRMLRQRFDEDDATRPDALQRERADTL